LRGKYLKNVAQLTSASGDHVLHPSVGETDLAIAGHGRVVEAVPLVYSPGLGRRGGQRRLAGSAPVSDEGRPIALARI